MEDQEQYIPSELYVSKLRFYSVGVVAQNKELNSKIIDVTPVEELNMLDGEITGNTVNLSVSSVDHEGKSFSSNVNSTITLKASWLPIGTSNRKTAPDVRRGESVVIYQFGDSSKYYWTTLKDDTNLRRLETVIYAFSASTKEDTEQSADNTYYLEISTHKKLCTFHTSKDNGEPFSYTVQINTKDGIFIVTDDEGNHFYMNSKERVLEMQNVDGSKIGINKKSIIYEASESITGKTKVFNIEASEKVNIDTPEIMSTGNMTGEGDSTVNGTMHIKNVDAEVITATNFVKKDGSIID